MFGCGTSEDQNKVDRVLLNAGSVLYFPTGSCGVCIDTKTSVHAHAFLCFHVGMWHRVESMSTAPSISINISLIGISWAEFLASSIVTTLWYVLCVIFRACSRT